MIAKEELTDIKVVGNQPRCIDSDKGGFRVSPIYNAFDFNRDGKLDAAETAIAYTSLFGEEQEEEEEEFLDDLDAIEEDW